MQQGPEAAKPAGAGWRAWSPTADPVGSLRRLAWRVAGRLGGPDATLKARLLAERERWLLWLPVALGCGVAAYFSLPVEPPVLAGAAAATLGLGAAALARRAGRRGGSGLGRALLAGLAATLAGFALAGARLEAVRAPVLAYEGTFEVTGRIVALEPRANGLRLLLDEPTLGRRSPGAALPPGATPRRVRVNLQRGGEGLGPGDRIRIRARLQPPAPPVLPGGFDYARQAYFEGLGAVGYAMGAPERLEAGEGRGGLEVRVAALRARIARRMAEILPGTTGAVAGALIAGVRAGIDDATWRDLQASGLAHIISISGLHMTMVAGTVFGAARWGLALFPWLALRVRVHKPAAVLAFAAAGFYFLLAGATVPTQRSFLMLGAVLLAVLVDRNPFSLRVLAWAALVVLAIRPEALVGASFQLSFAAVLALMAAFEAVRLRREAADEHAVEAEPGLPWRAARYVLGVAATTVIAGGATAPFTAYHFQNVTTFGVLANLLAVPLTTFLVMPAGLLGLALMPLGLDEPAFRLMGLGVDGMLEIARLTAALPGAAVALRQWPAAALALFAAGGLWLALWRRPWRLWGVAPCALAGLLAVLHRPPELLVDAGLGMAARPAPDGRVLLLEWERDGRRREGWLRALGAPDGAVRGPVRGGTVGDVACDREGCVVEVGPWRVALARTAGAAVEDCALVDLTLARAGPERCPGAFRGVSGGLLGPKALRASGGLALRAGPAGPLVETVAAGRGDWPWTRRGGKRGGVVPVAGRSNLE